MTAQNPGRRINGANSLDSFVLRGEVRISRTIPMGPYSSFKVEVCEEFYPDAQSFESKLRDLTERLRAQLIEMGVVKS